MKPGEQTLYKGRYPFVMTQFAGGDLKLEQLAFAVDPEAEAGVLPVNNAGTKGLDVVRLVFTNDGTAAQKVLLKLSGRNRNLPGHVQGSALITGGGEDVAMVSDAGGAAVTAEDNGLTLAVRATLGPK